MKNLRQVPVFTIKGTSFLVDIDQQVLRQTNKLDNEISFIDDMKDMGTHYEMYYDGMTGIKHHEADQDDALSENWIKVPLMVELDPEGMAAKYGFTTDQIKRKTDFEVIVDQDALGRRLAGELPKINIAGELFVVDLRLQELRHAHNFHPVLSLKSFDLTPDGWKYEAYYHPVLKQVVEIDWKLTEFPDHVVRIHLPNELGLDPVGTARRYGIEERALLRRHPISQDLKADVIPLSETHIPALIQHNRNQLQQEHQETARRIRPKQRPQF
ncbi:hypothetical protein [Mucilaginibacter lappiensis]|uniref:Uncharacterized protein n=1 Tax=Mucilaginibacter lappiensis TaxID=354630 RepID=A0A841JG45_9SPHI|nr:hypothetical protein [Mucilaginibacter lappiensis]MBB6127435.1 hypothetical protein [Mucilaginibacter lappiensis]